MIEMCGVDCSLSCVSDARCTVLNYRDWLVIEMCGIDCSRSCVSDARCTVLN